MDDVIFSYTEDGSLGLFSRRADDVYHSIYGAYTESVEKFVVPSRIIQKAVEKSEIRILDVCYGIGYNTKCALGAIRKVNPEVVVKVDALEVDSRLVYLSPLIPFKSDWVNGVLHNELLCFEDYSYSLMKFLEDGTIRSFLDEIPVAEEGLSNYEVKFYLDDARKSLQKLEGGYDAVFLDAFTPAIRPELWSYEFLRAIKGLMKEGGVFATYSSAAPVRCAMLKCGFKIGKTVDGQSKSQGTVGVFDESLIETPLDQCDLALLRTKAGVPYFDPNLNLSSLEILKLREKTIESLGLPSTKSVMKKFKKPE